MALFNHYFLLFVAIEATGFHWWEIAFIVSLSAAVENADDVAVVFFTHSTESCLEVVERDLSACIRHDDLALVIFHHTVAAVVDNSQCLLVGPRVSGDSTLVGVEKLFNSGQAEVSPLDDIEVGVEIIALNVSAENFHVLFDFL